MAKQKTKLTKNSSLSEIKDLRSKIEKWNHEYYTLSNPSVEDSVFDSTLKKLKQLEEELGVVDETSPTQKVGAPSLSLFPKHVHEIREMLSLDNAFNYDDLLLFDNRIKKILNVNEDIEYVVEPKVDGFSVSLKYENGILVSAATRGDGKVGELITTNVKAIKAIPKMIKTKEPIEVRGEIFLPSKKFDEINEQRLLNQEEPFANPRNAAAGTMRQLDSSIVTERELDAFFYQLLSIKTKDDFSKTQDDALRDIKKFGLPVVEIYKKVKNITEAIEHVKKIESMRSKLHYDIDGIVIKVNKINLHKKLGYTAKFPRWGIAFKLPTEVKETTLLEIFPTVGRTGLITYNAKLKPIKILGTTVSAATLHNSDYITNLDLRINDLVMIKKAGDIIPKVIQVSPNNKREKNSIEWKEDSICPSCGSKLKRVNDEVDQYCINISCPEQQIQRLLHFVSRNAFNIEFLAEKQIRKFVSLGFIKEFKDIFLLKNIKEKILKLDGYQETSVNKLLNSIEQSKMKITLDKLLFSFGIKNIGAKAAFELAKKYSSLNVISKLTLEQLEDDEDFGIVKAKSVVEWFSSNDGINIISSLKEAGIDPKMKEVKINLNSRFSNKKVLVTGTIDGATRKQVQEKLYMLGAKTISAVSKELDFLIVGENPAISKIEKVESSKIIKISKIEEIK